MCKYASCNCDACIFYILYIFISCIQNMNISVSFVAI